MRSYCSLFVDAGYLLASSSQRIANTSLRPATKADVASLLEALTAQVEADSGLPLLRIHWYDSGTRQGTPLPEQRAIAALPKVKLKLGRVGFSGEQKGVDIKLALDLITHSRNRAAEILYLISGDDDLSEAVEESQSHGVQVVGLVVPDRAGEPIAMSQNLAITVDRVEHIDGQTIDAHVRKSSPAAPIPAGTSTSGPATAGTNGAAPGPDPAGAEVRPRPIPGPVPRPAPPRPVEYQPEYAYSTSTWGGVSSGSTSPANVAVEAAIEQVVHAVVSNWWRGASPETQRELKASKPDIPSELDRALLNDLSHQLRMSDIPNRERIALRQAFWAKIDTL